MLSVGSSVIKQYNYESVICVKSADKKNSLFHFLNFCLVCGMELIHHHFIIPHKLIIRISIGNEAISLKLKNGFIIHQLI